MPAEDREGVVVTDRYDRRVYREIREASEALSAAEEGVRERVPAADLLLQDFWAGLFKADPEIRDEVGPSLQLNRLVMGEAAKTQEWADLRESTRLDEWASALGAAVMSEKVSELVPEEKAEALKRAMEAEEEARSLLEGAEGLDLAADEAQASGQDELAGSLRSQAGELRRQGQDMMAQAAAAGDQSVQGMHGREVRKALKAGLQEASAALDEAGNFIPGGWGTSPGALQRVDRKEKFRLAQRLQKDPKLREIARLAGRMTRIAMEKQRRKVRQEPLEVSEVESGRDLQRVLPAELVLLSHPAGRLEFCRRFLEGKLQQYRVTGKQPEGRGPLVVCVDSSGSMAGPREIWSKAVMVALFQVALRERRAFAGIHFGSGQEQKIFSLPEPAKATPAQVADMAAFFFGGGTDFEKPLRLAMALQKDSAFSRGDIIFITDGECRVSEGFLESFLALKRLKGVSVFGVVMPGGRTDGLKPFCDRVVWVDPGARNGDDSEALEMMFTI